MNRIGVVAVRLLIYPLVLSIFSVAAMWAEEMTLPPVPPEFHHLPPGGIPFDTNTGKVIGGFRSLRTPDRFLLTENLGLAQLNNEFVTDYRQDVEIDVADSHGKQQTKRNDAPAPAAESDIAGRTYATESPADDELESVPPAPRPEEIAQPITSGEPTPSVAPLRQPVRSCTIPGLENGRRTGCN